MKLRQYREQENMTLARLAELIGVSEVTISRYERDARTPRPEIMRRIEEITGGAVRPNDFISSKTSGAAA